MSYRAGHIGPMCLLLLAVGGPARSADEPAKVPEVSVAKPVVREVTDYEDFAGRTDASTRVDLRVRVNGELTKVLFRAGDRVKEGAVLFEIDPRPYQAQLDLALGQLELNKATLKLARATLARDQAAVKAVPGSVSQQQLDLDQAAVDADLARITVAEANAALAKLNLSYCQVTAPVSGRISRPFFDPGNLVQQNQTLLASLVVESPVFVYFDIDERTYLLLQRQIQAGKGAANKLPVGVGLSDEKGFPRRGELDFHSSIVDPNSGAVSVRTSLDNKDGLLLPGMAVRVRVALGAPYKALLVSERAIGSDQGLKVVYVVDADNQVQIRRVTLGALQPDGLRAITEGLKADDRVVTGRLAGLRPGMTVRPKEAEMPPPKLPEGTEVPPSVRGPAGPGILVGATYPGASATVVSETVRAPIEQQVTGLEKVRYLRSRCSVDGTYALDINFAPGADLPMAQFLVQNRVSLALPVIPSEVQRAGISVRTGTTGVLLIATLSSPNGRYDRTALGQFARTEFKDELARLVGVSEVAPLGGSDSVLRVDLDPDRLTAVNVNVADVVGFIQQVKRDDDPDAEQLGELLVKATDHGRVRLRDVARVELGIGRPANEAHQDGKPVVAVVVYLSGGVAPSKVRAAVRKSLADLRARLPEGLGLDITFDFTANQEPAERATAPEYLLLDLDLPPGSAESAARVLKRSETLLRQIPGVRHVLTFSANPFDLFGGRPCVLVLLSPADARKTGREELIRTVRTRLGGIEDVTVRLRDLSAAGCFPRCGYPIDLALSGPDAAEVRKWADRLTERLERSKKFTDVWANPDSVPTPAHSVELDRQAAVTRGVGIADIANTIAACAGVLTLERSNASGRPWRIEVRTPTRSGDGTKDLNKLKVRNANGQMVPLSAIAKVREVDVPRALDFFDLRPMVELTANPGAGASVEAGQKLCALLAEEVRKELGLTAEYRLAWLHAAPKP